MQLGDVFQLNLAGKPMMFWFTPHLIERFFSAPDSEITFRWGEREGRALTLIIHHGLCEQLQLAPDCSLVGCCANAVEESV
jgi:hypothetical protein